MNLSDYWKSIQLRKYLKYEEYQQAILQLDLNAEQIPEMVHAFVTGLMTFAEARGVTIADDRMQEVADEFSSDFWKRHGVVFSTSKVSDEKLLEIAQNPLYAPVSTWWLNEDTKLEDVHAASLRFARAIEALVLQQGQGQFLTDPEIFGVAQDPASTPIAIWWLRDHVNLGDVRQAAKVFARAVESQVKQTMRSTEPTGH